MFSAESKAAIPAIDALPAQASLQEATACPSGTDAANGSIKTPALEITTHQFRRKT